MVDLSFGPYTYTDVLSQLLKMVFPWSIYACTDVLSAVIVYSDSSFQTVFTSVPWMMWPSVYINAWEKQNGLLLPY